MYPDPMDLTLVAISSDLVSAISSTDLVSALSSAESSSHDLTLLTPHSDLDTRLPNSSSEEQPLVTPPSKVVPSLPTSPPTEPSSAVPAVKNALFDAISSRSATLCDDGIQRPPTPSNYNLPHPDFTYNQHNELIFDDSRIFPGVKDDESANIYKFDNTNTDSLSHATLTVLVVHLTSPHVIDYNFVCDFFVSYRKFVSSEHLMELLLSRMIWALQYINSDLPEHLTVGKQVLLRTFVVFRHWILNYFFDDFDSNIPLCDFFTETLNQVTSESSLLNSDRSANDLVLETKIMNDLKAHWLSMMCEFWNADISVDALVENGTMFQFKIPTFNEVPIQRKMQKSSTEVSIHSNPSFRRSAMLLLYDKKPILRSHPFDAAAAVKETSPQQSIQNLLFHYKLPRLSVNSRLQDIKTKALSKRHTLMGTGVPSSRHPVSVPDFSASIFSKPLKSHKALRQSNRHNRMNMTNSSVQLKKVSAQNSFEAAGLTNTGAYPSLEDIGEKIETKPEIRLKSNGAIENSGFSTNGVIGLPGDKSDEIKPPTPQKLVAHDHTTRYPMGSAPSVTSFDDLVPPKIKLGEQDMKRRSSVQRVVDGWKKLILSNTHLGHGPSGSSSPVWVMDSEFAEVGDDENSTLCDAPPPSSRQDTLSARVIDEIEFLIKHYNLLLALALPRDLNKKSDDKVSADHRDGPSQQENDSESLYLEPENDTSPLKKRSLSRSSGTQNVNAVFRGNTSHDDTDTTEPDINDLSDLNLLKIDNLISARDCTNILDESSRVHGGTQSESVTPNRASFMTPASLNWSEVKDSYFEDSATPNDTEDHDVMADFDGNSELNEMMARIGNSESEEMAMRSESGELDDAAATTRETRPLDRNSLLSENGEALTNAVGERPTNSSKKRMSCSSNVWFAKDSLEFCREQNALDRSSISTASNIARYCEDIVDLSIMNADVRRVSLNWDKSRSSLLSIHRQTSVKSYLTYDSAFSATNHTVSSVQTRSCGSHKLKKKGGLKDFREFAESRLAPGLSSASLPQRLETMLRRVSASNYSHVERANMNTPHGKRVNSGSSRADRSHSFESPITNSSMDNLNQREKNRNTQLTDASVFSHDSKFHSNPRRTAPASAGRASSSVAIQGMSSFVLRELAAIPDELLRSSDAIGYALNKLEGRNSKMASRPELCEIHDDKALFDIKSRDDDDGSDIHSQCETSGTPTTPKRDRHATKSLEGVLTFESPAKLSSPARTERDNENQWARLALANYSLLNKSLTVEAVMQQRSHLSFVLCYDSKLLASHFTIIERDVLQDIDWMELMEKDWSHELVPVNSWLEIIANDAYFNKNKGVNLVVARFNLMINWIISEIVLTRNHYERVCIMSRFIHIAERCFEMQNFSTLMQIILALTSSKLQGLNGTWQDLDGRDVSTLADLEEAVSPMKNFGQLRERLSQLTPSRGCIPFLGLYLSDLTFNAERPDYIKPSSTNTRAPGPGNQLNDLISNSETVLHDSRESLESIEPVINFSKFRTTVNIIRSLFRCIEWSGNYKLQIDPDLLSKCLYIRALDEQEMNYCIANSNAGY